MQTILTDDPEAAAAFVRRGEAVAFPTETVYGLGADATDPDAVARIFTAKGRPQDNPLIVHLADPALLPTVAASVPPAAQRFLDRFIPGPLTLILPRGPAIPDVVTAGRETVGVRIPSHPVAHAFLAACGRPVAAPSANRSGRPSPTSWEAVHADLDGRIPCILQGNRSDVGLESTVVDCTDAEPVLLRAGAVPLEALQAVVPSTRAATPGDEVLARSPGTRYRHYAPRARVVVVDGPSKAPPGPRAAYIGLAAPPDDGYARTARFDDVAAYAHHLFHFFRTCDADGLEVIYCQRVPSSGLGTALMDRLQRAAAG